MPRKKRPTAAAIAAAAEPIESRTRYVWTPKKELLMLETMQDMQRLGHQADSGAKPAVISAVIKAIAAIADAPHAGQVKTKIDTFKKDLKMWIKLNEVSGFGRDSVTGAITASTQNWNDLLAVKAHKEYVKFKDKSLANEELLRTLFLDSLATGRHVVTPQDIAADRTEAEEDVDAEGEPAEEKEEEEEEENTQSDLAAELEKTNAILDHDEERDQARLLTPSTPIAIAKSPLSTSSSTSSLKRIAVEQDASSRKRPKLSGPELLAQTIGQALGTLGQKMDDISIGMAAEAKSWTEKAMEAMSTHYMDLSQDDLFVLIDIFEEEAKARTFALMRPESLRREWVLMQINARTAWNH